MNVYGVLFLFATAAGIWFSPRKWAALPFLIGCCYMTVGQGVVLFGLNFPIVRILVLVGILRLMVRGEGIVGGLNAIDKTVLVWGGWLFFASLFHEWAPGSGPVYMLGMLLNVLGFYFMIRCLCQSEEDLAGVLVSLCLVIAPISLIMVFEQASKWNLFSVFGGVPEMPSLRNGRYRAQGPFNHAILAGTVGAACFPFAVSIWRRHRLASITGMVSSLLMVFASASSGPIMSVLFALFALSLWKSRGLIRIMLLSAVPIYMLLALVMERPPYYLISKIDLTGASSAWHRSYLIEQTIGHLDEWWLFGTDRTVHWMPNQGRISDYHTDITNQFIAYGVAGGLLCVALFVIILWRTFKTVGAIANDLDVNPETRFFFWCIGSSLFSLVASGTAVGFFGQSLFFLWFPIAALASFGSEEHRFQLVEDDPGAAQDMDDSRDETYRENLGMIYGRADVGHFEK